MFFVNCEESLNKLGFKLHFNRFDRLQGSHGHSQINYGPFVLKQQQ